MTDKKDFVDHVLCVFLHRDTKKLGNLDSELNLVNSYSTSPGPGPKGWRPAACSEDAAARPGRARLLHSQRGPGHLCSAPSPPGRASSPSRDAGEVEVLGPLHQARTLD